MARQGALPIQHYVGAALRFVRENLRFVAIVAAAGAGLVTLLSAVALLVAPLAVFASVGATVARAFIYAAFVGAALGGAASVRSRWAGDGWRIWGAMAIVGLFMFVVMVVLLIPGLVILFAGPMAPYASELEAAGQDQARMLSITMRFVEQNPLAMIAFVAFYALVWLLLTSRLFLAAPASAEAGRIRTFGTWRWTEGYTLAIMGARLMLLGPAYVFVSALDYIAASLVQLNPLDPTATSALAHSSPLVFLGYVLVTTFITIFFYVPLEAGLSTELYRRLKPTAPA